MAQRKQRAAGFQVRHEVDLLRAFRRHIERRRDHVEAVRVDAEDQVGEARVDEAGFEFQMHRELAHKRRVEAARVGAFEVVVRRIGQIRTDGQCAGGDRRDARGREDMGGCAYRPGSGSEFRQFQQGVQQRIEAKMGFHGLSLVGVVTIYIVQQY